jgi:DNA-directed RNA polymerase subunit RPC12/RpoP
MLGEDYDKHKKSREHQLAIEKKMICKCGIQYFNTRNYTSLQCKECGYELINKEKREMNYKKGKQFESAVEMVDCLTMYGFVYYKDTKLTKNCIKAEEVVDWFSSYHQVIEEKEDIMISYYKWDYINEHEKWTTTRDYISESFETTDGKEVHWLRWLKEGEKRKIESSKIRINMRTLEIVG